MMRALIKKLLRDVAEEVRECHDGSEVLAAYREFGPDWVLMDIKMPTVDGIAATRLIKAAFPEANILIVTDYDDPELRDAAHAAGARGYLTKEKLLDLRDMIERTKKGLI